jgi:hypothetical protein
MDCHNKIISNDYWSRGNSYEIGIGNLQNSSQHDIDLESQSAQHTSVFLESGGADLKCHDKRSIYIMESVIMQKPLVKEKHIHKGNA